MTHESSVQVTFNPILPWPWLAAFALVIVGLTVWTYRQRVRGGSGRGRWFAFGLRMVALLLCLLASIRPTVVMLEKEKQPAVISFLLDMSKSMRLNDEVGDRTRIEAARKALADGRAAVKKLDPKLEAAAYGFGEALKDLPPGDTAPPDASRTAIGTAIAEDMKREAGKRMIAVVLLSDGGSNDGLPPLAAAQKLRPLSVPIVTVGFGSETAGAASKDVAVTALNAPPTVFVKNELQIAGNVRTRGYGTSPIEVELYAEDSKVPVATATVRPAEGAEVASYALKWTPQAPGESRLTVKAKPKDGELLKANNEMSTYVTVKRGGLNVLYIQGPNFTWDYRYLIRSLDPAGEIRVDLAVLKQPAQGDRGELADAALVGGAAGYDVYILGDLPADFLTPMQQKLLVEAVRKGAGLVMLGGRSSFGAGGWANTPVAEALPTYIRPDDGQIEPEAGVKMQVNVGGLESYVMKVGATRAETQEIWERMPNLTGSNVLGRPKEAAVVWAATPEGQPIMVGQDGPGKGRVLAFGGETWVWARDFTNDLSREAHRKFWRQAILWLAHKEDAGESQVKVALDQRRVPVGGKVEITATARDAKNEPIEGVTYEATVERIASKDAKPSKVELYPQPTEARGPYFADGEPGEYRITVKATKGGQSLGSDSARFQAFQDDRELENPAADHTLLRQLSEATGGKFLPPEQLGQYLRALDASALTETLRPKEHRVWDNWPFFLAFVCVLSLEWYMRKRIGWV